MGLPTNGRNQIKWTPEAETIIEKAVTVIDNKVYPVCFLLVNIYQLHYEIGRNIFILHP